MLVFVARRAFRARSEPTEEEEELGEGQTQLAPLCVPAMQGAKKTTCQEPKWFRFHSGIVSH